MNVIELDDEFYHAHLTEEQGITTLSYSGISLTCHRPLEMATASFTTYLIHLI